MLTKLAQHGSKLALLLVLALAVSACGRRGNLEAPPSELSGFEDEQTGQTQEPETAEKPDKPFILDPLL